MAVPQTASFQRLTALAACLCAAIQEMELPEPCFCGVVPGGAPALEYGGYCSKKCGMAWVRLADAGPIRGIGSPDRQAGNCGSEWGLTIEIGITRCMPVGDSAGNPPTASQLLEVAEQQHADMLAMRKAILCCDAFESSKDYIIVNYTTIGPDGGIVGGFITLQTVEGHLAPVVP